MYSHHDKHRRTNAPVRPQPAPAVLEPLETRQLLAVDLVAAFINAEQHTLAPGEDFTAAMVVNNDGSDQSPGFVVEMHLSTDSIFGNADDIVLGMAERPSGLAGDSSTSIVRTFTIPNDADPGDYFLGFSVDPSGSVSESNENNNSYFTSSSLISVTAGGGNNVDLDVFGNGQEILDGAHIPTADNNSFFGDVDVGEAQDRVFTLMNDGAGVLQILNISVSGVDSLDFVVLGDTNFAIGAGQSVNVTVRFAPLAEGIRVGQLQIQTNDTDDGTGDPSVFGFAISGAGHEGGNPSGPEIEVRGNGLVILDGDLTPVPGDHTSFGRLRLQNASLTRTFTVFNTGDSTLTFTGISLAGRNASDFVILNNIDSIATGEFATLRVRFDPSANGRRIATVRLLSNDADEGEFTFRIAGRGAPNGGPGDGAPEIEIQGHGQSILDGDTSPSIVDHTSYGRVRRDGATRTRTYTIFNSGDATLDISSVSLSGRNADDFVVVESPTQIAAGSSATLRIRFDPSALGDRRADVQLVSDDSDEGTFTFRIRGVGTNNSADSGNGEITVSGLLPIEDGDATPTVVEGTNFGPVNVGQAVTRTFTITNTGSGVLSLTGSALRLTGPNAGRFSIIQQPDVSLNIGESTTFVVQFTPINGGRKRATIEILSNDANEAVFNFDLVGRGRLG